jgi:hypothetical protein
MSHSTQVGFNEPLFSMPARFNASRYWPENWLCDAGDVGALSGVGNISRSATTVLRFFPPAFSEWPGPVCSEAVGVGQCATVPRFGDFRLPCDGPASFQSRPLGVGNKPDPVAPVRGANGASRDAVPLRVIPARGQVPENTLHSSSKESCDVLHDDVAGS